MLDGTLQKGWASLLFLCSLIDLNVPLFDGNDALTCNLKTQEDYLLSSRFNFN